MIFFQYHVIDVCLWGNCPNNQLLPSDSHIFWQKCSWNCHFTRGDHLTTKCSTSLLVVMPLSFLLLLLFEFPISISCFRGSGKKKPLKEVSWILKFSSVTPQTNVLWIFLSSSFLKRVGFILPALWRYALKGWLSYLTKRCLGSSSCANVIL